MKTIAIIPARYKSSRFEGKMLCPIMGKSLIQRTYESAKACKGIDTLVIAADDERIEQAARGFGAEVVMTSPECSNGTFRLVDAIQRYPELLDGDLYINIQGDRPCTASHQVEALVSFHKKHPERKMSTLITKVYDKEEFLNPASVKCVSTLTGEALYFSRQPIPYGQDYFYKHIGLYAYTKDFLLQYATLPDTPLQLAEDLEQLKVLEHGFSLSTIEVEDQVDPSVDYQEDIEKVEKWLCQNNLK